MEQLVEANIVGVHAYQILLARKQSNMDPVCWPASDPKDADLVALGAHQTSLLSAAGRGPRLGPRRAFDFRSWKRSSALACRAVTDAGKPARQSVRRVPARKSPAVSKEEIRSIANLYQTVLEVERDGDRLQELYAFYIALGLPLYVGNSDCPAATKISLRRAACWKATLARPRWIDGRRMADRRTQNLELGRKESACARRARCWPTNCWRSPTSKRSNRE